MSWVKGFGCGIIWLCWASVCGQTPSPCAVKVTYEVRSVGADYEILLQLREGRSEPMTVELYDLYTGKTVSRQTLTLTQRPGTVFTRVTPSLYVIYITTSQCPRKIGIGGREGILVGNP